MEQIEGSFRDPSGLVYSDGERIVRTVNAVFAEHWNAAVESGFFKKSLSDGAIVSFTECEPPTSCWKALAVEKLPFISYPFEWCFGQLRDAALLTLKLGKRAIRSGLTLKDASAYNVQFVGSRPVFIDLLSFEKRVGDEPWAAYRQFCMHFLAPLALISRVDLRCGLLSKLWIEGIPLDLASKLLPGRTYFNPSLLFHLHLHSRFEKRHGDSRESGKKARAVKVSSASLIGIMDNLAGVIGKLRPRDVRTEWSDYYNDTNYDSGAAEFKQEYVRRAAAGASAKERRLAVDLGANTGRFSRILAEFYDSVLALDIDPLAVERHYLSLCGNGPHNVLPLVMDLGNSSPQLGWALRERDSFSARCRANLVTALALVHHLVIGSGVPLRRVAGYFAELLARDGTLVLEFVPKEDSQTERLLSVRKDVHDDYNMDGMRAAFSGFFREVETAQIPGSLRTLHIFRRLDEYTEAR